MPWKEICTVELREQLVSAVLRNDASVPEASGSAEALPSFMYTSATRRGNRKGLRNWLPETV